MFIIHRYFTADELSQTGRPDAHKNIIGKKVFIGRYERYVAKKRVSRKPFFYNLKNFESRRYQEQFIEFTTSLVYEYTQYYDRV